MGETRVDLQHLLEDLRDAYTGALEETILTEIVANVFITQFLAHWGWSNSSQTRRRRHRG